MTRIATRTLAVMLATALAGSALAAGITGHLDPFEANVQAEIDQLADSTAKADKKRRKKLSGIVRGLNKKSLTKSVKGEIKGARKAAKQLLKLRAGDQELLGLLDTLVMDYRADIDVFRTALEQQIAGLPEGSRKQKRAVKRLEQADAFLQAATDATDAPDKLKFLLKAVGRTGQPDATSGDALTLVVSALSVANGGIGGDVDGDGFGNNALGLILDSVPGSGELVTQAVQQALAASASVILLDAFGIDSIQDDVLFTLATAPGADTDGNPDDNFGGSEEFTVAQGLVLGDGHLAPRATGAIEGGAFSVRLTDAQLAIPVGGTTLSPLGDVVIDGGFGTEPVQGTITFVISISDAEAVVGEFAQGMPLPPGFVALAADVDTDGNQVPDAISVAFEFSAVPATFR